MDSHTATKKLAQPFDNVKSLNDQPSTAAPEPMIHHKALGLRTKIIVSYQSIDRSRRYGVSSERRILTPGVYLKQLDRIRAFLEGPLGLAPRQAEVTIRLLRLYAYYGLVYPKAAQIAGELELTPAMAAWRAENGLGPPRKSDGCSRATFWRTIKVLEDLGLVEITNRYVVRPHAQISNSYRLDKLMILIARYLAEHGQAFYEKWIQPYLSVPGRIFWPQIAHFSGCSPGT